MVSVFMAKGENISFSIEVESFDGVKSRIAELIAVCLNDWIAQAHLTAEKVLPHDMIEIIEKPPESSLGDYAFPCFRFAKVFRKKPQAIADELKIKLLLLNNLWVHDCKVVGAFLNIFISQEIFAKELVPKILSQEYFKSLKHDLDRNKTKTMVEYSQPNTHKEFHVGHGRNVCLGDSICRIYDYCGFKLIRVNYIGDEGTHVAKALWQIKQSQKRLQGQNPVEFYGQCYVEASRKLREASHTEKQQNESDISKILSHLESKKGEDYVLWQKTRQECLDEFSRIYKWLDVHFDTIFYESDVSEESQAIVEEYIQKDLFKESQNAYGIDMEDVDLGFFMARKSDGTTPYVTKDLALARRKFEDFNIDRSIYVVGSEQQFHFKQLFEALKRMGFEQASQCFHLSYAHVVRPEGKMSSRSGNTFTFKQLITIMENEINKKLKRYEAEWSKEEIEQTAHKLSLGAIKYGMLSSDPNREIVFDAELWTSFEGNTGPYLMYSYARTSSILRKSGIEITKDFDVSLLSCLKSQIEYDLLRIMYDFNDAVRQAVEQHKPSIIAHHLYYLCKCFNRFYVNLAVLNAEDENLKLARLSLLKCFSLVLKEGLFLLGITPPERM